ncbi:MAG: gliding motility-associated C-terminal domain-containing protein [Sporocytophaga sp.]|uniref:T9SS type B sorting domain-containing protein n=1 Tax=Sporocytophaga sp. TaxID=2231183 RepID=UPI001B276934|nr:gliding motility-associated C-terminal domain-containing protein [Sporocytophaga sp.]MBO9701867.1 gliding motility-associated C-terminal domain-containing protein [Sporocytophaga sp.]
MKKYLLLTAIFLVYFLQRASAVTYTVNSTSDANTGNPGTNTGTLRWCMTQSNLTAGSHTINFNIPGAAPYVINIASTLPQVNNGNNNITIDATSQPGYTVGVPVVIIRGKTGLVAMQIQNSNATGHIIKGFIFQSLSTGISITGGSNHGIYGCWFGINDAGNSKAGVTIEKNGIEVSNSPGVNIGGTNPGEGNVISGCANVTGANQGSFAGIFISGGNTNNTRITGNFVGTDATGTLGGPNLGNGAVEYFHQNGITISGTNNSAVFIRNNVISNNFSSGIRVVQDGSWIGSNNVTITGNFIGTDKTGMQPLGNGTAGIWASESQNLTIGGNTAVLSNVISANGKTNVPNVTNTQNATEWDWYNSAGIYCDNISNSNIKGNYVGTDITGNSIGVVAQAMGNLYAGIKIKGYGGSVPKNLTIGGTTAADGNIVGGNGYRSFAANASYPGHGILLQGTTVNGVNVYKNYVGISPSGVNIGNKQDGISLQDGVKNCNIGGANLGNITSNNTFGVFLQKNCNNNTISGNLVGTGVTGTGAAGNSQGGICLQQLSNSNTISSNIIGGNSAAAGIIIRNGGSPAAPANNNIIQSNTIGTTTGGAALPNLIGIYIGGGSTGTIVSGNTIKLNTSHGISLDNGQASRITSNLINDNGGNGIDLANGSSNNIIGGASSEANSIIANASHGVGFSAPNTGGSVGNAIDRNIFSCNVARGINLNGGNANLAAPTFTGAPGSFNVSASGGWIELYRIDGCHNCDALSSNPGTIINNLQGATLVLEGPAGSAIWNNINPVTYGGTTNKDFTAIVSSAAPSTTAGATTAHNTSEFSSCISLCKLTKPQVTAFANAICIGESDTLTANTTDTGVTFTWYKTSVTPANQVGTGQTFVVSPSASTTYIVVASKANCAADTSAPFALKVNPIPSVTINASSTALCSNNGSTTLSAVVSGGTTPYTYIWADYPASSFKPGNVSTVTVSPIVSTIYTLLVMDSNGCANPVATKEITVSTYTQADAGSDQSLCGVSSVALAATNPSPATGQWTPIAGTPSSVIVAPVNSPEATVTGLTAGTTKLVWTVTSGVCISRDTVTIVDYTNVATADAGSNIIDLCNVSNTNLSGIAVGGVGHWTILDGPGKLSDPDNATTTVTGLVPGSTTMVEWRVVNGACWKTDTVRIINYRTVLASIAGARSHSLCNEVKDTLTAVAPTLGTGSWSRIKGQGTILNPDKNLTAITGLQVPDTIVARWTVVNGACEARDSVTIINYQKIDSVFAGTDKAVCNITTASVSGNVPVIGTGSWSKLNPNAPGIITSSDSPQTTITGLSYNVPVDLIWKITNGTCKAEDTVRVTANDQQPANAGPNHYLCVDSLVNLAAVPPAQGYGRWSIVNPGAAYFVNGIADSSNSQAQVHVPLGYTEFEWKIFSGGCMGETSSRTIVVRDTIPTVANAGSDAFTCDIDSNRLHGNKAFVGRGKWYAPYDSTLAFDNRFDSLTWVHNLKIGSNILVWSIHSPYGVCDSISDTVNVIRMHVAFGADSINVCYGSLPVFFGDTLYALPGNYNYRWNIDIPGAVVNDTNYFTFPYDPSLIHAGIDSLPAPGNNYWVKLRVNGLGCFVQDSVLVKYHKLPEAVLTAGKDTICLGTSVDLIAGSNVKPIAYAWLNNIGTLEDTVIIRINPYTRSVEPEASTLVAYYVIVLDSNGCWSLPAMDTVKVIQHQDLVIPNLMTPNGDGKNDTYVIRDVNQMDLLPGATFEVYNRWGERVFRSTNYRNNWGARDVNDGIYFYYLKSGCGTDAHKGWLQIISNEKNVEGF